MNTPHEHELPSGRGRALRKALAHGSWLAWALRLLAMGMVAAAGCSHHNCDQVESELRDKETKLAEMSDEVHRLRSINDSMQRELAAAHQGIAAKVPPEVAAQAYGVTAIVLGRQTGGYNHDDAPGDKALQVVLEPRDVDGHPIKAPGTLAVQALEILPEGMKKPLCTWQVGPEQLRFNWRSGLFSTGYFLILPWKAWPSVEKLRVIAQLTTTDGRLFEAERDVTVHLAPPAARKPPSEVSEPPAALPFPPPPTPVDTPLPLPRKVDPPPAEGPKLDSSGPAVKEAETQPAAHWQASPLAGAVQLLKPIPVR
jgi:hypothetical protein